MSSSVLYAEPSFLEGVARILDWGNTLNEYNESVSSAEADLLAVRSDWRAVGEDLRRAIEEVRSR